MALYGTKPTPTHSLTVLFTVNMQISEITSVRSWFQACDLCVMVAGEVEKRGKGME